MKYGYTNSLLTVINYVTEYSGDPSELGTFERATSPAKWVVVPDACEPGWLWNESTQTASRPSQFMMTAQEVRDCFTDAEKKAILLEAKTDVELELFVFKLQTRTEPISNKDPDLLAAVAYLDSKGLASQKIIDDTVNA